MDEIGAIRKRGEKNRSVGATKMNLVSSRSHSIFTIHVETSETSADGDQHFRVGKLNMVDLAGSERTHKTGATGQTLRESKYINTSLHFLEVCIMALGDVQKGSRTHVPYRNSVMTSVLRDSLGGNCKTSMIATFSAEKAQTEETISTAKFAQRVALVQNKAQINEERDPKLVIRRLKEEIKQLKSELSFLRNDSGDDDTELTQTELNHLKKKISNFVVDPDAAASLSLGEQFSFRKMQAAFSIFRDMCKNGSQQTSDASHSRATGTADGTANPAAQAEIDKLREAVARRDHEIAILVKMAKRNNSASASRTDSSGSSVPGPSSAAFVSRNQRENNASVIPQAVLGDKKKAFEYYCNNFADMKAIHSQQRELQELYPGAKKTAAMVNDTRVNINKIKTNIEQVKVQKSMLQSAIDAGEEEKHDEAKLKQLEGQYDDLFAQFEDAKGTYKYSFEKLRKMKSETEHIKKQLTKSKKALWQQFGEWFELMRNVSTNNLTTAAVANSAVESKTQRPSSSQSEPTRESKSNVLESSRRSASVNRDVEEFLQAKKQMLARLKK